MSPTSSPEVHERVGDGRGRLPRSPFGITAPSIMLALAYGMGSAAWVVAGGLLPGGRWLAVHLFTLGALTNLILAFSEHFGRTLSRHPDHRIRWQPVVVNLGVLLVLVGLPTGTRWAMGLGATTVTGVVLVSYGRLRRMRTAAVGARFGWIVRMFERAHGAFVHGAVLGLLMGVGVFTGPWYTAARVAHLHVNVLGWAGLTLLATLVFFGPTMVRTRIIAGADDRAAQSLRHGARALTVGVALLLATGVGGTAGVAVRLAAAIALAGYALAATTTCRGVVAAARQARPSATRGPVVAACSWLPLVVWADAAVVATGQWRWLDAVGLAMLLGVLAQTITAVLTYLAPMLRTPDVAVRARLLARFETASRARTTVFNLGVAAVVAAGFLGGAMGMVMARAGWLLVMTALGALLLVGLSPVPLRTDTGTTLRRRDGATSRY